MQWAAESLIPMHAPAGQVTPQPLNFAQAALQTADEPVGLDVGFAVAVTVGVAGGAGPGAGAGPGFGFAPGDAAFGDGAVGEIGSGASSGGRAS